MATLEDVGERNLVENIRGILRKSTKGIGPGDDAATLRIGDETAVVCSDLVTFERHMPAGMTFEHFGWTAAAVNFSDLASMGARPVGFLASMALPNDMQEKDLYDIVSGMDQCAEFCETEIIGGDTKPGNGVISGTALGVMEGRRPMTRDGASVGDIIAVTGTLGSPAAGFYSMENNLDEYEAMVSLTVPVPRVAEGIALSKTGAVTSCIDLSDGLAVAARSVCDASHVGMEIEMEFLPEGVGVDNISDTLGITKEDLMIYWGGEYELLFTFKREDIKKLYGTGVEFSVIGLVTDDDGPYIRKGEKREAMHDGRF